MCVYVCVCVCLLERARARNYNFVIQVSEHNNNQKKKKKKNSIDFLTQSCFPRSLSFFPIACCIQFVTAVPAVVVVFVALTLS